MLDIATLHSNYLSGLVRPVDTVNLVLDAITRASDNPVWIARVATADLYARAEFLANLDPTVAAQMPLFGVPFAVKDNIDVAGLPTTAGCPAYAYTPSRNATVVQKLLDAGAILIGKTNLDQFATGLVGTRSPYGACRNSFDPAYISGGSSSGSAVAVALGMVSFSLGTDTAGSGRVPAALNNIVGLKPSRGLISAAGVVPACRSLDCVSILSLTVADAQRVLRATQGYDTADPYSRRERTPRASSFGDSFYFGIPAKAQLEFFHDSDAERQFDQSVARMRSIGGTSVEIDFSPFLQAARLLYGGPWTAERFTAIKSFLVSHESELLPVIRDIILPAASYTAVQTFDAMYALESLKQQTAATWAEIDMLLVPTIPTIYRIEEVDADPIRLNANLGYYTNFVNLLDLCGVAIPSGIRDDGLPAGMTMLAPALNEDALCRIAARCHAAAALPLGATGNFASKDALDSLEHLPTGAVYLAVVGAHLSGQPLNHQLTDRGGTLVRQCRTAPGYRLYALGASVPSKPGLKRTNETALAGIEVEIWALPITELGAFTAEVPSPLGIGTITLEDGEEVKGFVCETYAFETALDISHYGGWRNYLSKSAM